MFVFTTSYYRFTTVNEARYLQIENTPDYRAFTFISQGRHGDLLKIVVFEEVLWLKNTFNLALGTVLSNGKGDFDTISNNGDRNKILVTVVMIVNNFIEKYPDANVYLTGSDKRRTMLYQRAIIYGYEELIQAFNIWGDTASDTEESEFEPFDPAKIYSGFLIQKR